jgi:hypothetical protein
MGDSWSTYERPPSWFFGLLDLLCIDGPVETIFFLTADTISLYLSRSSSKLGRQSRRVACLSICVSAWDKNCVDDFIYLVSLECMGHFSRIPPKASTATGVYLHSSLLIFFLLDLLLGPLRGAILIRVIYGEFILF